MMSGTELEFTGPILTGVVCLDCGHYATNIAPHGLPLKKLKTGKTVCGPVECSACGKMGAFATDGCPALDRRQEP